jgi:acyl dehydratase
MSVASVRYENAPGQLRALGRYLISGWRGGSPSGDPRGVRPRVAIEGVGLTATPKVIRRYLRATDGGTIGPLESGGLIPPTLPSIWESAFVLDLLRLCGFPFPRGGIIHLGSERIFLRLVEAASRLSVRIEVKDVRSTERGTVVVVNSETRERAGRLCGTADLRFLLRGVEMDGPDDIRSAPAGPAGASGWSAVASWRLRTRHARRFARASGDFNPVHLGVLSARLLGFRRPLLHGACTEAMVAHGLVRGRLGGDPAALRRLEIDFSAPLQLPAEVHLLVSQQQDQEGAGSFRLTGADLARTPYAHGTWVGEAASS